MKKLIITLTILIGSIGSIYGISSQRNHNHHNAALNSEFDNLYVLLEQNLIPRGKKLYFNGSFVDYIFNSSSHTLRIYLNDNIHVDFNTAGHTEFFDDIMLGGASGGTKLVFGAATESGGDEKTYIHKIAGPVLSMVVNDVLYNLSTNDFTPVSDGVKNLGFSTSLDWNILYYHSLSQHSSQRDKQNIEGVDTTTLLASRLPSPKTYERKTATGTIEYGLIAEDCPEEVIFREDGEIAGINTNALIAYLIGVIKEQDKRITLLEK